MFIIDKDGKTGAIRMIGGLVYAVYELFPETGSATRCTAVTMEVIKFHKGSLWAYREGELKPLYYKEGEFLCEIESILNTGSYSGELVYVDSVKDFVKGINIKVQLDNKDLLLPVRRDRLCDD